MIKYLRLIFLAIPRLIINYLKLKKVSRHLDRYTLEERYALAHKTAKDLLKHFRVDWHIEGKELFDEAMKGQKKVLIVNNHESLLDAVLLLSLSEEPFSFILKKEAQKMLLVPTAVKVLDGLYIDREDLKQSVKVLAEVRNRLANDSIHMLIYPEGTRNKEPMTTPVAEFHAGTFKPALQTNRPILAIASYGSFRLLATKNAKRNPLWMKVFPLVDPSIYEGKNTHDLAALCQEMIASEVEEFKKRDEAYFAKGYHKVNLKKGPLD